MAKKIIQEEVQEETKTTINEIVTDFGRNDLNELRDKVNELIRAKN